MTDPSIKKIIHVDMDCFYAAIEIRDNPSLANKPVAVGGQPEERSVLCTCNYIARQFGVRSAMASAYALRLCPDLIILPVNMNKYREASNIINTIFQQYTTLIEPLSLDEAYLDVTDSKQCQGSATWIAEEIRKKILKETGLTASAGVAPNKFLAKIASGWKKPNGLHIIRPCDVEDFVKELPVEKLFGVGKVTTEKLHKHGIKTCADLRNISLSKLTDTFGSLGKQLYEQSRGIDNRAVNPDRLRKSLSVERTFLHDINISDDCSLILTELFNHLNDRIKKYAPNREIKNQYMKIKTSYFKSSTIEKSCNQINYSEFKNLLQIFSCKEKNPIRLLGIGVHFVCENKKNIQRSLF